MVRRVMGIELDCYLEPVEGECRDCGFDALLRLRGYHLSSSGVTLRVQRTLCGRCRAEKVRGGC